MKIVVNRCYGGFGISHEAQMLYAKKKGIELFPYVCSSGGYSGDMVRYVHEPAKHEAFMGPHYLTTDHGDTITESEFKEAYNGKTNHLYYKDIERNDPALVATVEELGELSCGWAADLQIVDIPDDVEWEIDEYDGYESVEEKHRSW
jgi:hypothetical protein